MKKLYTYFLIVFITALAGRLQAQTFPVQAGLMLQPPYSVYLSDYATPGTQRLGVNLLLTDMSRLDLQVRLRFTIEGQGFLLRSKEFYLPAPLTLEAGVPLRLSGDELAGYLSPRNLQVVSGNERTFIQTGKLPEGMYRFCVEVLEHNRTKVVSNSTCGIAWVMLNNPPALNFPEEGEKIRAQEPQNLRFNWTPMHSGSPNAAFSTEYEFSLIELWPETRNLNDAIITGNTEPAPIKAVVFLMNSGKILNLPLINPNSTRKQNFILMIFSS